MSSLLKLIVFQLILILCIYGCGGGSNSSSESPISANNEPSAQSKSSSSSNSDSTEKLSNLLKINPLRDLGLGKGENVCFRIKSYNNVAVSDFSKAICGQIMDDHSLTLLWSKVAGKISGYYVYYGTNKNNAENYLTDVLET